MTSRPFPVGSFIEFTAPSGAVPPQTVLVHGTLLSWGTAMARVELLGGCLLFIDADWLARSATLVDPGEPIAG